MQDYTFLWHDYETFGINTRRDRPAQFAAIRTDAQLNEIGEPVMLYCQPAADFLPDPQSCLITGITPQLCLEKGIPEYQFAAAIEALLAQPGTIGVGYNTIRFDDEITRFMFWRNLIDPYAREWKNNCGRWDLLDVVRTTYALRPEGIVWPKGDDGKVSFRLDKLTVSNGISHEAAHDALSDVRATIALARLIRQHQPKLFDFCLGLHKKDKVSKEIGLPIKKPFLHVSGMIPSERGCISIVWPLAIHPKNKNEVIVWDLQFDPSELYSLDADSIKQRMFSKAADLPEGVTRLPVKSIHINKSPIVIGNLKTLNPAQAERWNIDLEQIARHTAIAETGASLTDIWDQVFANPEVQELDADEALYAGFIGNNDRCLLDELRTMKSQDLAAMHCQFQDQRLDELFFRYRARNFPESLNPAEQQRWEQHRANRLHNGFAQALTVEQLFEKIDALTESGELSMQQEEILGALYDYADQINPAR